MTLINKEDLIASYDKVHQGPPGGARKLMVEAEPVDAIPVEWINSYIEICNLLDLRVNVPASKIISVMINTWRQETKSDAIDCIASVWATKQEAKHDT